MLFLAISDIQGHVDALRAVLATAERRAFQKLLVAGDVVFPGPEPLETWRRLASAGAVMVQGLSDKALVTLDPTELRAKTSHEKQMLARMRSTREALGDLICERLRRLPTRVRLPLEDGGELLLIHGAPADPAEALSHDMSDEELNALIGDEPADVIVCGMSHVPFDRTVSGVRIVNVGSVGDAPDGSRRTARIRRSASSIAHATWIESRPSGVTVEQVTIPLGRPRERLVSHG